MSATLPPSSIKVGERHRQDLGDLASLIESIKSVGLLNPITVTTNGTLVAGHRRLVACQSIGMDRVPVRVVAQLTDALSQLRAERDENICRLAMQPSELVALGLELEKLEQPKAKDRQREGAARGGQASGKLPEASKGSTRDIVGSALGWSGRTYGEAKSIVQTASDPDEPKEVRAIAKRAIAEMDESGKVSPAYRKVAEAKNPALADKHPQPVSQPTGVPTLVGKKPNAGNRTVRAALASLKQAALDIDSVASAFDSEAFGDLSILTTYAEADEWLDLLADAALRLNAHVRTVKRYRQSRKEATA